MEIRAPEEQVIAYYMAHAPQFRHHREDPAGREDTLTIVKRRDSVLLLGSFLSLARSRTAHGLASSLGGN